MNAIQVKPLISVDGIPFGTPREEVRAACGGNYREFRKSRFSKNTTDDYGNFHVYYDGAGNMAAVEFFEGSTVEVRGTVVFPSDLRTASKVLKGLKDDGDGYLSTFESVCISAPEGRMDSILFGSKGYFG